VQVIASFARFSYVFFERAVKIMSTENKHGIRRPERDDHGTRANDDSFPARTAAYHQFGVYCVDAVFKGFNQGKV